MQRYRKRRFLRFLYCPNLEPGRKCQDAVAHSFRRFRICQFLVHCSGYKDLLKQSSEEMFLLDGY